jgi:hypothetical protein
MGKKVVDLQQRWRECPTPRADDVDVSDEAGTPRRMQRAARRAHPGVDDRVDLVAVVQTSQVLAIVVRDRCGLA